VAAVTLWNLSSSGNPGGGWPVRGSGTAQWTRGMGVCC